MALALGLPALAADWQAEGALGYRLYQGAANLRATALSDLGPPYLRAAQPLLELGLERRGGAFDQALRLELRWPGALRLDDGTGRDRILERSGSSLVDLRLGYGLDGWALGAPRLRLGLGGLATCVYERMALAYQGGGQAVRAWELGLGLGLTVPVEWRFLEAWRARAELRNTFYLPWLSVGRLRQEAREQAATLAAWRTELLLEVARALPRDLELAAAYGREEAVGHVLAGRSHLGRSYATHQLALRLRLALPGAGP